MQKAFLQFLKGIIVFTLILFTLEFISSSQINEKWVSSSWPFVVIFFLAFTIVMHYQLLKSTEGNPKKFVFTFLLMTTVKILLYLAVILIYSMFNRPDAMAFILAFFLNYFFFTIFELSAVMKLMKKLSTK